jgi:hypothetical protein
VVGRIRGILALSFDSEFSFYFGNAGREATLDLCDGFGLSDVASVIEVLQIVPELDEQFARKTVAHGPIIFATGAGYRGDRDSRF